jgi:predicted transcriptional regulator
VNSLISIKHDFTEVAYSNLTSAVTLERSSNNRGKAIFLILLLLSSGLAPAASSFQRYESDPGFFHFDFSPTTLTPNPNVGQAFFFIYVGEHLSTGGSYNPISAAAWETPGSLNLIPVAGSGGDYLYARQGNVYNVFPENIILENGGSLYSLAVFGPLLTVWLDSDRRRSRFRIYVEILDLLKKGPMTPYEVSFHLRLNSKRTREYIEFLAGKNFLECSDQEGRSICTITPPGATFVQNMRMILGESE